jgi:hypothetical protein
MNIYVFFLFIAISIFILIVIYKYYKPYQIPNVELKTHLYQIDNKIVKIFNPSFIEWNDKIICSARLSEKDGFCNWKTRNIFTYLNENLQPGEWKPIKFPIQSEHYNDADYYQYEDMRLFNIQNKLFSLQTFVKEKSSKLKIYMTIAEWDSDMNLVRIKHYDDFKNTQKNWMLVQNQNQIYMITDFYPFRYYDFDPNTFEISNKTEIEHEFKGFVGCKVYSVDQNKITFMVHKRSDMRLFYNFRFFEVDLTNKKVYSKSSEMSFRKYHGFFIQYPHMIQKIKDKHYLSLGIEDCQSMILELKDIH